MTSLAEKLTQYAAYHRDRRNVATHFFGIPMIVLAIVTLLGRPAVDVGGFAVTPAIVLFLLTSIYYMSLELRMGSVLVLLNGAAVTAGQALAHGPTADWLAWGIGLFVVGWAAQFLGHYWERRKPAFIDDVIGLLIGPLFLVAELAFLIGWREDLRAQVSAGQGAAKSAVAG